MKTIKISLSCMLIAYVSLAQNITNTLGTGGLFSIKNNTTTFLSLSQSTGDLSLNSSLVLPYTENSIGSIYKGTNRFLHTYGPSNTFLGINSGNFTLWGTYNSAFGYQSLYSCTSGSQNSAFGMNSLFSNTAGSNNSAFGSLSLANNTTGNYNSAYGLVSLTSNTSGNYDCAFGGNSLNNNTTGSKNSAFGFSSLFFNITGYSNSAFGYASLESNSTGFRNTAIGNKSLFSNSSGFQNTALGDSALYLNTGNYNTAVGFNAGSQVTTGANLTLIGIDANPSSPTAIDQITLGNVWVSSLRCNVQTITSLSDARDKKNITDLSLGLDFITKLKPRQFNWDKRDWYDNSVSDGSKTEQKLTAGFIAQELDEVQKAENADWLNLVLKDNPEKLEATYGNLLPVMVKAIQELNDANEKLKTKNEELEEKLSKIERLQNILVNEIRLLKNYESREIKTISK